MAFKILHIDHIGIGVSDLAAVKDIFADKLGMFHQPEDEIVESQKVKVSFFPCGDAELEFLESTTYIILLCSRRRSIIIFSWNTRPICWWTFLNRQKKVLGGNLSEKRFESCSSENAGVPNPRDQQ